MTHDPVRRQVRAPRSWKQRWALLAGSLLIVTVAFIARRVQGPEAVRAQVPPKAAPAKAAAAKAAAGQNAPAPAKPQVVAVVNGERISREELGKECLRHYGTDVLESLVNKHLISQHCKARGVAVTKQEVDAEIDRMAERFSLPREQWLKVLRDERGILPEQYARDIIWPTVALRKLAAEKLTLAPEELQQAYETQFGPSVQCRLIACDDRETAVAVREEAAKNPDNFGNLARAKSVDTNSASASGLIQPIRHHLGDPNIERVAFALRKDEVSEVIAVGEQYVILKCEAQLPPRNVPLEQVRPTLEEAIRDKKLRLAADELLAELQRTAVVENVLNDPQKRAALPGVAAMINGQKMSLGELAEECMERHGQEVLDGAINRRLIEQACKKRNVAITNDDLMAEVARAARSMGKTLADDAPDVEGWMKEVTAEQDVTREAYLHDTVWPTVALKKLVGENVEVSPEDLQRGYEANFGPRMRCRAIVLNNLRKAQEVWDLARKNPTVEFFGELAEQYSVEAGSKALRGEVPPIQKHGGQPTLEREAFALQEGELSGVVQVGDKFVILRSEGLTKPNPVSFEEARPMIEADLREKKARLAMAEEFQRIQEAARIDNYLAGSTRSPEKSKVPLAAPPGSPAQPIPATAPVAGGPRAASATAPIRR